jgi:hypothetical protein
VFDHRTARPLSPEVHEATVRVESAAALLARGLLGEAPLAECAESALVWLDQADHWLERVA